MKSFLYQSPDGYCYNSDTIFLFNFITKHKLKGNILDIGTGVAILSVLIGKKFNVNIDAIEKQEQMYKYAKKNFEINKVSANLILKDFTTFGSDKKYDYIVSNPPFYKVDTNRSKNTSIATARYEDNLPLKDLIQGVSKILGPRGYFIFCYDASYTDEILQTLRENKINPEILQFIHPKSTSNANIVIISARKGSKAVCKVIAPVIVFEKTGKYTKEAEDAFLLANTHSIKAFYD